MNKIARALLGPAKENLKMSLKQMVNHLEETVVLGDIAKHTVYRARRLALSEGDMDYDR